MPLQIDHGRRLEHLAGRLCLTHELSVRPDDDAPAGFTLVRAYATASGSWCLWRRSLIVHPEPTKEPR